MAAYWQSGQVTLQPTYPFFPARHGGLPDLVGQLLSRVAELQVDGPELLRLRDVHRPLHQPADLRFDLRSEFLQERFDALFPGFVRRGRDGTCSHAQLLGVRDRVHFRTRLQSTAGRAKFPPN